MELQLVILHEFFAGVRLQPVINPMHAIESSVFKFTFLLLVRSCRDFVPTNGGLIPSWLEEPTSVHSTGQ